VTEAAVFGARGRMGRMMIREAEGRFAVVEEIDAGHSMELDPSVKVVFDFSLPSAWNDLNRLLSGSSAALVSGTTGLEDSHRKMLRSWSRRIPVFYSSNMSIGVHVMGKAAALAQGLLGEGFDCELIEFHHGGKADSPSGTALGLLEITGGRRVHGRKGITGPREKGTVGVHSVRGGDVPGEHHLYFLGQGERLVLSHIATDRRIFALGALRAAEFVLGKDPGLYGMEDML
jgi:4-hydroxy-tetrahydrodipicolinate reductase